MSERESTGRGVRVGELASWRASGVSRLLPYVAAQTTTTTSTTIKQGTHNIDGESCIAETTEDDAPDKEHFTPHQDGDGPSPTKAWSRRIFVSVLVVVVVHYHRVLPVFIIVSSSKTF